MTGTNGRLTRLETLVESTPGQGLSRATRRVIAAWLTVAYDPDPGGVHPDLPDPQELDALEAEGRKRDPDFWRELDTVYGGTATLEEE